MEKKGIRLTFRICVRDFEEVSRTAKKFQERLKLPTLQHWAKAIEIETGSMISKKDVKESIHIEVIEVEPHKFEVKARGKKEVLPSMAKAIENKLGKMPLASRSIFKTVLDQIEKITDKSA
jgi:hypothetical protein